MLGNSGGGCYGRLRRTGSTDLARARQNGVEPRASTDVVQQPEHEWPLGERLLGTRLLGKRLLGKRLLGKRACQRDVEGEPVPATTAAVHLFVRNAGRAVRYGARSEQRRARVRAGGYVRRGLRVLSQQQMH